MESATLKLLKNEKTQREVCHEIPAGEDKTHITKP